jgi:anti-sigma factor RsiW
MPGSQERVSADAELSRYLDGELSPAEVAAFEVRLRESPALRRELAELRAVGAALRVWSRAAEDRAGDLLGPTLERARADVRRQTLHARLGYVGVALALVTLPWARFDSSLGPLGEGARPAPAAIERVEATDLHAQVFVVGSAKTPVLWLADDAPEEDEADAQDPG